MYYILEVQTNKDGTGSVLPARTTDNRNEAEAIYHTIMASAAVSDIYYHGAVILDESCFPLMYNSYNHETQEE